MFVCECDFVEGLFGLYVVCLSVYVFVLKVSLAFMLYVCHLMCLFLMFVFGHYIVCLWSTHSIFVPDFVNFEGLFGLYGVCVCVWVCVRVCVCV